MVINPGLNVLERITPEEAPLLDTSYSILTFPFQAAPTFIQSLAKEKYEYCTSNLPECINYLLHSRVEVTFIK